MASSVQNRPAVQKKPKLETWAAVTVAFIGAVFFATICSAMLPHSRTHDFLGLYTAGVIAKTDPALLYDADTQTRVERGLVPDLPVLWPFPRPAFAAILFMPLAFMPLKTAFAVWIALGIAAAFAIWFWAYRRYGSEALVYCSFFVPLGVGIAHGQDTAFLVGTAILAYCAAKSGRNVLCGLLLALLLEKFHLFLLIPVILLVRREWRILAGYIPGALMLVAISSVLAPPRSYLAFLTNPKLEALNPSPDTMFNLHSIAVNFGVDYAVVKILLSAAVLAAVVLMPRSAPLERWFWAAIAGGLLISPHTYGYDSALLLAPILGILADSTAAPGVRWIAGLAVIPFPYLMTLFPPPYSAGPALLISILFCAIAWPEWFDRRAVAAAPVIVAG